MDKKGVISLEAIFSIFIILLIVASILFYVQSNLESDKNIESSFSHRLILDNLANCINQVNSNGEGFSKKVLLPQKEYAYKVLHHHQVQYIRRKHLMNMMTWKA